MHIHVEGAPPVPSTTLLEIPPAEQVQMRAVLRRTRYGYLLAFHILLFVRRAEIRLILRPSCFAPAPACIVLCGRIALGAWAYVSIKTVSSPSRCSRPF